MIKRASALLAGSVELVLQGGSNLQINIRGNQERGAVNGAVTAA